MGNTREGATGASAPNWLKISGGFKGSIHLSVTQAGVWRSALWKRVIFLPNRQCSWMRRVIRRYAPQPKPNSTQDGEASTGSGSATEEPCSSLQTLLRRKGYFLAPQLTIVPVRVITPSLAGGNLLPLQWHRCREGHTSADHSGFPFQNVSKAAAHWHALTLRIYLVWHNLSAHRRGAAGAQLLWFLRNFFICEMSHFWSALKKAFQKRVILLLKAEK